VCAGGDQQLLRDVSAPFDREQTGFGFLFYGAKGELTVDIYRENTVFITKDMF